MKRNKFSLIEYSCLAGVFISLNSKSTAQVISTDIEPDIELQFDGETAFIDMDNNGTNDFAFLKTSNSWTTYTTSGFSYILIKNALYAGPYIVDNEVACYYDTHSGTSILRPYALSTETIIGDNLNFENWGLQLLALNVSTDLGIILDWAGSWWKPWLPEIEDHYLGVHFVDNDENYHYGWIRCSVLDSVEKLVIKDFAYETLPNYPIKAGDTTHFVAINNLENSLDATVYSFNKCIYIQIEIFQNAELIIYDLNGKQIINEFLQNKSESISMINYPAGVYLVTLLNDGKRFDKKVFIE